jgi:hypothetical protein
LWVFFVAVLHIFSGIISYYAIMLRIKVVYAHIMLREGRLCLCYQIWSIMLFLMLA